MNTYPEGQKAMEIFDLVVRNKMLPEKIGDLIPLSFIGQAAVSFYRIKVKAMNELGMTEDQRKITLRDGQDAGKMLLTIEGRIGEIYDLAHKAPTEPIRSGDGKSVSGSRAIGPVPGSKASMAEIHGESKLKHARAIARNPEAVQRVIKEAEENEDIPTKTAVLNRISYEKEKKRREEAEGKRKEIKAVVAIEQVQYINALDRCISILPQKPPKTWNEDAFKEAKAKAQIIVKRLEVFE